MRADENDHVRVHELRGFSADDLRGAFKEVEAISRATRCKQYLFSLSLSPPEKERVSVEVFENTIARVEKQLGLEGQPRAVVFHEKEGRRHAHCVWSRIDMDKMTARQMSYYKTRLMGVSRELYLEHGWEIPKGMLDAGGKSPANFTLAEWQQANRKGVDPRWIKAVVQECWRRSDNAGSFERALDERCLFLAKGDKRVCVVLDHMGEVHSLSRLLGTTAKDVRARIPGAGTLRDLSEARHMLSSRMTSALRRHVEEARKSANSKLAYLAVQKLGMKKRHVEARTKLEGVQNSQWRDETLMRAARLPKGLKGLWHRITGQYQHVRALNEREAANTRARHAGERQIQHDRQLSERRELQTKIKALRAEQAKRLFELRHDLKFFAKKDRALER